VSVDEKGGQKWAKNYADRMNIWLNPVLTISASSPRLFLLNLRVA
jgi:hypothetical protein